MAPVHIAHTGGTGPDLCNAAIHGGNIQQRSLRAEDLPLRIVHKRMGGNIELKVPAILLLCILLQTTAHILHKTAVEINLQGRSLVSGFAGLVGRLPLLTIISQVFPLEGGAVTALIPEFRLLQMHRLYAGIHGNLGLLRQIGAEREGRTQVRHIQTMEDGIAIPVGLAFIPVFLAVPITV